MRFFNKKRKILLIEPANSFVRNARDKVKLSDDILTVTDIYEATVKATALIDEVYEGYIDKSCKDALNNIYGSEISHIYIKKSLHEAIRDIFLSSIFVKNIIDRYKIDSGINFIPKRFSYSLFRFISNKERIFPENVIIPAYCMIKEKIVEYIKGMVYSIGLIVGPLFISLLMRGKKSKPSYAKRYDYAVHIWDSWLDSYKGNGIMDFLEGDDCLNTENTLYIVEAKAKPANLEKLKSSGYHFCYFNDMFGDLDRHSYIKDIYPSIKRAAKAMVSGKRDNLFIRKVFLKVLKSYMLWEIFFQRCSVKKFVSVQSPGSLLRTLHQKKYNAATMFIYLSSNYSPLPQYSDGCVDLHYGYMLYDEMVSSRVSNEFFSKNNNFIDKYIDCGIIRADRIFELNNNPEKKHRRRQELGIPGQKTIIGFFDTDIGHMSAFDNEQGYKMINNIIRLLESDSNYYIIYKSRVMHKIADSSSFKSEIDKLINHERVFCSNRLVPRLMAYDLAGLCDVVIGCFFSSLTLEAVAGGIKTLCYLPDESFIGSGTVVTKFPNFCVTGYQNLDKLLKYWLVDCSREDFYTFQNAYIKDYVDIYCDGRAGERLRATVGHVYSDTQEQLNREIPCSYA